MFAHRRLILLAASVLAAAALAITALPGSAASPLTAVATLRLADGTDVGWVTFEELRGDTLVRARIRLPESVEPGPGFHGFHVHANDDPANGAGCVADPTAPPSTWFASADGHYSEVAAEHPHHDGDLPPLLVMDDGSANHNVVTDRLDPSELAGKAVIVHALPDNQANIPLGTELERYMANSAVAIDRTLATGNAGDRLACGVLRLRAS